MKPFKVQLRYLSFWISPMSRANCHSQSIDACLFYKIHCKVRIGIQIRIRIVLMICLAHMSQFPFYGTAHSMSKSSDDSRAFNILLIRQGGAIVHNIGKSTVDTVRNGVKIRTMVKI